MTGKSQAKASQLFDLGKGNATDLADANDISSDVCLLKTGLDFRRDPSTGLSRAGMCTPIQTPDRRACEY